jgi:hypothetical protein
MTLRWQDKLKPCGLYYDGFISGKELNDLLENHRRDTASSALGNPATYLLQLLLYLPPKVQVPLLNPHIQMKM